MLKKVLSTLEFFGGIALGAATTGFAFVEGMEIATKVNGLFKKKDKKEEA